MEVVDLRGWSIGVVVIYALLVAISLPAVAAAADVNNVPVPTPSPSSDGTAIDQGIAYVLMLLALVLTYIIH